MARGYDGKLHDMLVAHAPEGARAALREADHLGGALAQALTAARAAWPGVAVEDEAAVRYLAERLPNDASAAEAAPGPFASDLYLACACAAGDAPALAAFERTFLVGLPGLLPRTPDPARFADEVKALVRDKLFVPRGERPAKITEYAGRCDLASWVKVVVVRTSIDLLRTRKPTRGQTDELLAALPSPSDDPELLHLKQRYGSEFRAALHDAARRLSGRDRTLLWQHHVDGMTVEQLARLHQVHRVTAVRWVVAAREALATETRRLLEARLNVDRTELESIMRLVRSQLDFSIRGILKDIGDVPPH